MKKSGPKELLNTVDRDDEQTDRYAYNRYVVCTNMQKSLIYGAHRYSFSVSRQTAQVLETFTYDNEPMALNV